jgi:HK97 family phage portal protein
MAISLRNLWDQVVQKLNPAQALISREAGWNIGSEQTNATVTSWEEREVIQRGVSMIVSGCSLFDVDIKDKKLSDGIPNLRKAKLDSLLNHKPNPFQDIQKFRNQIFLDFIMEGNIFIYWDGAYLYHLPAANVTIIPDEKNYVKEYQYNRSITYLPSEIIHIQDLNSTSIFRGTSRLVSATRTISTIKKMGNFQDSFFENGAVPGLVLETENTLSTQAKERTIQQWTQKYNTKGGARRPMIIDSGLKVKAIYDVNFKELDFDASITSHEAKLLKALGVPPILLDGGNNANIAPNLRLFYLETVIPIVKKYISALEFFFGFDLELITNNISAIQPELKEIASYYATLTNAGIITPDEARIELRYEAKGGEADNLRIPANIAGSAANPSIGGKPSGSANNN